MPFQGRGGSGVVAFRQVTASLKSQRRVLRRAERQSRLPFSAEDDLVLSGRSTTTSAGPKPDAPATGHVVGRLHHRRPLDPFSCCRGGPRRGTPTCCPPQVPVPLVGTTGSTTRTPPTPWPRSALAFSCGGTMRTLTTRAASRATPGSPVPKRRGISVLPTFSVTTTISRQPASAGSTAGESGGFRPSRQQLP